jgi:hypothetical protein
MMKKVLLVVLLVTGFAAAYADSLPMMAGVDISFSPYFGGGSLSADKTMSPAKGGSDTLGDVWSQNYLGFGAFFDMKYVRLDLSYNMSMGVLIDTTTFAGTNLTAGGASTNTNAVANFNIQLLGKYPIDLAPGIAIWPALGLEYNLNLAYGPVGTNMNTNENYNDLNDLWLKAGIGADFKVSDNFYIVPLVLFGLDLTPVPFKTDDDNWKKTTLGAHFGKTFSDTVTDYKLSTYMMKVDVTLGVAYKF